MAEYLPSRFRDFDFDFDFRFREVNILPLFTEIEKNNYFSIYTGSDLNNIFRRKSLKIDLIYPSIHAFTPAILFLFSSRIIHSLGGE